jgi:phenylalanyl-tRNA synthetase beta chain
LYNVFENSYRFNPVVLKNDDNVELKIPLYRHDINIWQDIAEEVAISYGYENIKPKGFLFNYNHFNKSHKDIVWYNNLENIKSKLSSIGLSEVVNYSFLKDSWFEKFNIADSDKKIDKEKILIKNPIHSDYSVMRDSLIPAMIKNISTNISFNVKNLKFFEIGSCFYNLHHQTTNIAFAISGSTDTNHIIKSREFSIMDVKSVFVVVTDFYGLKEQSLNFEPITNNKNLNKYASYKIIVGKTVVGIIGQVHPNCLEEDFDIKNADVFVGEVYLEEIEKFAKKSKAKFNDKTLQNIQRSLSCVFDKNITIASILKTISKTKIYFDNSEGNNSIARREHTC